MNSHKSVIYQAYFFGFIIILALVSLFIVGLGNAFTFEIMPDKSVYVGMAIGAIMIKVLLINLIYYALNYILKKVKGIRTIYSFEFSILSVMIIYLILSRDLYLVKEHSIFTILFSAYGFICMSLLFLFLLNIYYKRLNVEMEVHIKPVYLYIRSSLALIAFYSLIFLLGITTNISEFVLVFLMGLSVFINNVLFFSMLNSDVNHKLKMNQIVIRFVKYQIYMFFVYLVLAI